MTSAMNIMPALNTLLILILIVLILWRNRIQDGVQLFDEIEALKLRLSVQEKVSPCAHCRTAHAHINPPDRCDC